MLAAPLMPSNVESTDENILRAMEKLRYPVLATLKMDGIRAIKLNDLVSRTLKPIPNVSIRRRAMKLPAGFDMELWNPELSYDQVESIVMSREHKDSDLIQFHVLDWFCEDSYWVRMNKIYPYKSFWGVQWSDVVFDTPIEYRDANTLLYYFKRIEEDCGEGICFRTPNSPYKQGRSTLKEQYLVKLCRYLQSEAEVLWLEEQMENANETKRNAVGAMDRSSHQHNMYGKDTLGSMHVRDIKTGQCFSVGTGFTDKLRKEIWTNPEQYIGKTIVYRHKPHGQKLLPRSPIFKGWRKEIDIV